DLRRKPRELERRPARGDLGHAVPRHGRSRMIGGRYWAALGLAATVAGVAGLALAAPSPGPEVVVYKSPTCGCCKKWVEHVQAAGFRVTVHDTSSLAGVMERYGVPRKLTACHTAVVDGYVESEVLVVCPHCGEANELGLDPGGGSVQEYVEDCQVCCRPWRVTVRYAEDGTADVFTEALDE